MTYDPFQTYSALGSYPGVPSPFSSQFNPLQAAAVNPMAAYAFQPTPYPFTGGIHPQLQLASILASRGVLPQPQASPFTPFGAGLENPLLNPILAQLVSHLGQAGSPYGQIGSPFGQTGSPFGQVTPGLAPQSWVGQQGIHGSGPNLAQILPLIAQQVAARSWPNAGLNPWAMF